MKKIYFAMLLCASLSVSAVMAAPDATKPTAPEPELGQKLTKSEVLSIRPYDIIMGKEDAPVTIFEYSSLSCPHCASFHNDVLPELKTKYIDTGKVKLVARNFPTNPPALSGSMLTMCVDKEQYYPFLKVLFRMQDKWAFSLDHKDNLKKIASVGGVSHEDFDACMANAYIEKKVLGIRRDAEQHLDIQATPSFFINNEVIQGAGTIEGFSEIIDKQLAKTP
jgi:protein-disulfide isomerase